MMMNGRCRRRQRRPSSSKKNGRCQLLGLHKQTNLVRLTGTSWMGWQTLVGLAGWRAPICRRRRRRQLATASGCSGRLAWSEKLSARATRSLTNQCAGALFLVLLLALIQLMTLIALSARVETSFSASDSGRSIDRLSERQT